MHGGEVLVDGDVEAARSNHRVQEVYIGSGAAAVARAEACTDLAASGQLLSVRALDAFYGKSQILADIALSVRQGEIVALLGRNGAGKSTLLKTLIGDRKSTRLNS